MRSDGPANEWRADFRICHRGRWISAECKVAGQPLTPAQEREANRLRNSGGMFVVVRRLSDLTEALAAARDRGSRRLANGLSISAGAVRISENWPRTRLQGRNQGGRSPVLTF